MKVMSKLSSSVLSAVLLAGTLGAGAAGAETVAYPTADAASFLIDVPGDWEMEQAEAEGDYVTFYAPTGAALMFRTIPASEEELQAAVEDTITWIIENHSDVQIGEPSAANQAGLKGFVAAGEGKDEEGTHLKFGMAWFALPDGNLGEIWFSAAVDDAEGSAAAAKVIDSFRAP
jgi:hypothetical protein